jgi:hypothetical protein
LSDFKKIDPLQWEAWLDKQIVQRSRFGTLRVTGLIECRNSQEVSLLKIRDSYQRTNILKLEIILGELNTGAKKIQRLHYVEAFQSAPEYQSIEIFYNDKCVLKIRKVIVIV